MTSRPSASSRVEGQDTFWGHLSPMARHGICVAVLLLVTASFFSPVLFEGKRIHGSDTVSWRANAEVVIDYQEKTGERALWAPNTFGGMPAYMIKYSPIIPQVDTVINAARGFARPAAHFFVLLLGMYLLVFYLTRNHFSGLLSAIAFGFTTYIPIILGVGHNTKFFALAFAPFVLLAFVYTLRNPSLLGGLLFAAALSLDLRTKHPQIAYYVLMIALVWWVVELIWAWREDTLVSFSKSTGWLALGTGLALLMVAQPYLGIYQYKQFSVRGAEAGAGGGGGMAWEKAMQWSQGPQELFTLVVAEAFGGGGQTYWGPKPFTEGPHYLGGVVVALSGLAVWRIRSRVTWGIGAGVAMTVLFALGKNASWINWPFFEYFPFFSSFRAPETWLSVSALGLAVLAGLGLDYGLRTEDVPRSTNDRSTSILYAFGAVLGVVLLVRIAPNIFFDFEKPNERERLVQAIQRQRPNLSPQNPKVQRFIDQRMQKQKKERRAAFTSDATRTLVVVVIALLALWVYRRETISGWMAGSIVVFVVLVDLWGVDTRYLGDDAFSTQQDPEEQIPTTRVDRFIKKKVEESGGPGRFRVLPLQTGRRAGPMNNAIPSYHYQSLGGYHAAKLQRYQQYVDHVLQLSGRGGPNENALDLMNAQYVIARQQLPGMRVVYRDEQSKTMVLENPDAVPRGFLVGQTEVVSSDEEAWKRLRGASFNPRTEAILHAPLEKPVTPIDSASTAAVTLESYSPPEIEWSIQTDSPRLFVASEIYYPAGWKAYIDGEEVPIHRVNYLLRGVHVPEGNHTLTMRFEPRAHQYGLWISGVATVLNYGGILYLGTPYLRRRFGLGESEEREEDA